MPLAETVELSIVQEWAEAGDEPSAQFLTAAAGCPAPIFGVDGEGTVLAWFADAEAADAWLVAELVDYEVQRLADGQTGVVLDPMHAKGGAPGSRMVWVAWDSGESGWVSVDELIEPEE